MLVTQAMEILDLRHFRSAELRPLLEAETEEWAQMLSWDYTSSAEMILRYMDARILPGYAAVEEGQVIGYTFFVYEGSKGVIGDLFVHPDAETPSLVRRQIEERLLGQVIDTLQVSPGVHRIEAQLLLHDGGSLDRIFTEEGFRRHPRLFMSLPLRNGSGNSATKGANGTPAASFPDVEFRKWSEDDFQSAAALITAAYREHVDSEINDQYRTLAGSLRFLNNIIRFPGCGTFDAESSFVARSRMSGAMLGLILCSRVKSDVGHVTQVCLTPEQRNRGLGQALISTAAGELRRRSCTTLSLTVTQANVRAVELYKKLGFSIDRVFDAFVWEG
ncbi:MAG: GNAT family N-acetyltransferase [Acidobacteriales bacterium]|nr:GNAT family N-acetyltransferase [Terriglobales bacterium]